MPKNIVNLPHLYETVYRTINKYLNRRTITGLILLYGSAPLSCKQYLLVSSLVSYFIRALDEKDENNSELRKSNFACGLTKARQSVFPHFVNNLLPTSIILTFQAGKQSIKTVEEWVDSNSSYDIDSHFPIEALGAFENDDRLGASTVTEGESENEGLSEETEHRGVTAEMDHEQPTSTVEDHEVDTTPMPSPSINNTGNAERDLEPPREDEVHEADTTPLPSQSTLNTVNRIHSHTNNVNVDSSVPDVQDDAANTQRQTNEQLSTSRNTNRQNPVNTPSVQIKNIALL